MTFASWYIGIERESISQPRPSPLVARRCFCSHERYETVEEKGKEKEKQKQKQKERDRTRTRTRDGQMRRSGVRRWP